MTLAYLRECSRLDILRAYILRIFALLPHPCMLHQRWLLFLLSS